MKSWPAFFLIISFVSCTKSPVGDILIRVNNKTSQAIENVSVYSFSSNRDILIDRNYGSVSSNTFTPYLAHERAYDFPLLKYNVPNLGTFEIKDIRCGNGLRDLSPGRYSLVINGDLTSPILYFERD